MDRGSNRAFVSSGPSLSGVRHSCSEVEAPTERMMRTVDPEDVFGVLVVFLVVGTFKDTRNLGILGILAHD